MNQIVRLIAGLLKFGIRSSPDVKMGPGGFILVIALFILFESGISIGDIIRFFLVIIVTIIIIIASYKLSLKILSHLDKKEDAERKQLIVILSDTEHFISKIESAKTLNLKLKYCDELVEVFTDYKKNVTRKNRKIVRLDTYIQRAQGCKKVLPVISKLKKAKRQESLGNRKEEKRILLDALNEIHKFNVTDAEFLDSTLLVGNFGLSVSPKDYITGKLKRLGWKRKPT